MVLTRIHNGYDFVPADEKYFLPGVQRISVSKARGEGLMPIEILGILPFMPSGVGARNEVIDDREDGWRFTMNLQGMKDHCNTLKLAAQDPAAFLLFLRFEKRWKA